MGKPENAENTIYTAKLRQHNSKNDLWLAIDDIVYDMTDYVEDHPGGDAIVRQAGQDATEAFKLIPAHSTVKGLIQNLLKTKIVGVLEPAQM